MTSAITILHEAADLVGGERRETYGDPDVSFWDVALLWTAFLGITITAEKAALMMVLLKIARTKAGAHQPDNYVDMAGYAALAGEVAGRGN